MVSAAEVKRTYSTAKLVSLRKVVNILVTLAAHNQQHGRPEYSVGAAAILRAREKDDMYDLTFDFSSDGADGDILILTQGCSFARSNASALRCVDHLCTRRTCSRRSRCTPTLIDPAVTVNR